ncbi:uncharacterized protein LOC122007145 isoform X4 [Zingiber officinale]|nr:uncharacterized protein LOC122007145 isoform X4 [Zingiber officinale]
MERSQLSRLGIPTLDVCFATIFHDALILRSQNAPRRAATASEAWFVCWRGGESDGEIQGPSQALVLHFPPIQKRQASGPMYCYKDGKLTALEEANQPDGIYVHEKCVV